MKMKRKSIGFKDVRQKFLGNKHLLELSITYHILEVSEKLKHLLATDKKPFKTYSFLKELADLKILLDLLSETKEFQCIVEKRRKKFIEKLRREKITQKILQH